jgi:hypothetical protein
MTKIDSLDSPVSLLLYKLKVNTTFLLLMLVLLLAQDKPTQPSTLVMLPLSLLKLTLTYRPPASLDPFGPTRQSTQIGSTLTLRAGI